MGPIEQPLDGGPREPRRTTASSFDDLVEKPLDPVTLGGVVRRHAQ
jgi:hypothetical protein